MSTAASVAPSRVWVAGFRRSLSVVAAVLWVVCLVPPLTTWSHRYEFVESIQFAVLGFWVPTLLTAGAPWGSERRPGSAAPARFTSRLWRARRRVSQGRALVFAAAFVALSIFWRLAPVVDGLVRHEWLLIVEALTLSGAGVALMSDLIESPPLRPGVSRPYRIGLSAAVMWSAWVFSYLEAMSRVTWYHSLVHVVGRGLSGSADQQLSAAAVWFMTGVVFVPIIFWNLIHWLESEEDPDDELSQLIRQERTRGFFGYRSR